MKSQRSSRIGNTLSLGLFGGLTFGLVSCSDFIASLNEPISSDYNPLDGPSVSLRNGNLQQTGPSYEAGEWVETATANATFFRRVPRGNAQADQILPNRTPLKVLSTRDSYLKVELENGSVGYVPTIMVASPSGRASNGPLLPPQPSNSPNRAPASIPPSAPAAPLNTGGSSLIPPPSNFGQSSTAAPSLPSTGNSPSEIVIPTTPPASAQPTFTPAPIPSLGSGSSLIPPPTNSGQIDQTLDIE